MTQRPQPSSEEGSTIRSSVGRCPSCSRARREERQVGPHHRLELLPDPAQLDRFAFRVLGFRELLELGVFGIAVERAHVHPTDSSSVSASASIRTAPQPRLPSSRLRLPVESSWNSSGGVFSRRAISSSLAVVVGIAFASKVLAAATTAPWSGIRTEKRCPHEGQAVIRRLVAFLIVFSSASWISE